MKLTTNLYKPCLAASVALFGQNVMACEEPQVTGYDFVCCSHEGLTSVKQNDKQGFIDKTGKRIAD